MKLSMKSSEIIKLATECPNLFGKLMKKMCNLPSEKFSGHDIVELTKFFKFKNLKYSDGKTYVLTDEQGRVTHAGYNGSRFEYLYTETSISEFTSHDCGTDCYAVTHFNTDGVILSHSELEDETCTLCREYKEGKLITEEFGDQTLTYHYNEKGLLEKVTTIEGEEIIKHIYDRRNRLVKTISEGEVVELHTYCQGGIHYHDTLCGHRRTRKTYHKDRLISIEDSHNELKYLSETYGHKRIIQLLGSFKDDYAGNKFVIQLYDDEVKTISYVRGQVGKLGRFVKAINALEVLGTCSFDNLDELEILKQEEGLNRE